MPEHLAPQIHMAVVGDDVVILDVARDAYSCLAGGAALVRFGAAGEIHIEDGSASLALNEAGFLGTDPVRVRRTPPALPSLAGSPKLQSRPTLRERLRFALTAFSTLRHYNKTKFSDLIVKTEQASLRPSATEERDRTIRCAALFARWLPWVPGQGVCLYRAYMLRQFLSRSGLQADWVFGVATWPFSAHCWLQIGDVLLDDDVDRVSSYTPIMVV